MRGSQTFFCKWFISGIVIMMFTIFTCPKSFCMWFLSLMENLESPPQTQRVYNLFIVVCPFIIRGLKTFQSNSQWPITIENFRCPLLPNQDHISMYKYSDVAMHMMLVFMWFENIPIHITVAHHPSKTSFATTF